MLQHRRRHFKQKSTNQVPRIRHTTLQHFHSQMMLRSQVVRLRQGRTHRNTCLARVVVPDHSTAEENHCNSTSNINVTSKSNCSCQKHTDLCRWWPSFNGSLSYANTTASPSPFQTEINGLNPENKTCKSAAFPISNYAAQPSRSPSPGLDSSKHLPGQSSLLQSAKENHYKSRSNRR